MISLPSSNMVWLVLDFSIKALFQSSGLGLWVLRHSSLTPNVNPTLRDWKQQKENSDNTQDSNYQFTTMLSCETLIICDRIKLYLAHKSIWLHYYQKKKTIWLHDEQPFLRETLRAFFLNMSRTFNEQFTPLALTTTP